MKRISAWAVMLMLLTFTGCLNTFYPIFTTENLVTNEKILGNWVHGNEKMVVARFDPSKGMTVQHPPFADKALVVIGLNAENQEEFRNIGYLVKIGDHHFLDMFPDFTTAEKEIDELYRSLFLKQHIVYKVDSLESGNILALQRVSDK